MSTIKLSGNDYFHLIQGGSRLLHLHEQEVNDLNVFPIPDGDTGKNMKMTIDGGIEAVKDETVDLEHMSQTISQGMLLGARGNSGVILSQFFAGLSSGLVGHAFADVKTLAFAFKCAVKRAYASVITPTEGTILTVAREATENTNSYCESIDEYLDNWIKAAKVSLANTPNLLAVLKEADVVDSGGAGLIYIIEGMYKALIGEDISVENEETKEVGVKINPDLFTSDMAMEYGYCTEILVRLQKSKCDVDNFKETTFIDYLKTIGNSIVCFKTGTIVKVHVHTFEPYKVLEFAQKYGEFLTIKIENMMLQNQEVREKEKNELIQSGVPIKKKRHPYGVVTVASGSGIKDAFLNFGADVVIDGGQTMNPSSEDFIKAFDLSNADHIFVFPNNSNIIMACNQAASMYKGSDIIVIPTKDIGQAFSALQMIDFTSNNLEEIKENFMSSIEQVKTIEVSKSIRDSSMNGLDIHKGDYLAVDNKNILANDKDTISVSLNALKKFDLDNFGLLLIVVGKYGYSADAQKIVDELKKTNPYLECQVILGQQDIYDYILVLE